MIRIVSSGYSLLAATRLNKSKLYRSICRPLALNFSRAQRRTRALRHSASTQEQLSEDLL